MSAKAKPKIVLFPKPPVIEKDEELPGCPGWMVTFGDAISLLMTFFVLILAFSDVSQSVDAVTGFMRVGGGDLEGVLVGVPGGDSIGGGAGTGSGVSTEMAIDTVASLTGQNDLALTSASREMQTQGAARADSAGAGDADEGSKTRKAFEISIDQYYVFSVGKSILWEESRAHLKDMGIFLQNMPNDFLIIGYADDYDAIRSPDYPSNEHLAISRAQAVAGYLEENYGIDRERIGLRIGALDGESFVSARKKGASGVATKVSIVVLDTFDGYDRKNELQKEVNRRAR